MNRKPSDDDVAIVGVGVVSPYGCDLGRFYEGLRSMEPVVRAVHLPGDSSRRASWWSTVRDFNAPEWMDEKLLEGTDVIAQWALGAAEQAIRHARISLDPLRTGIVHGTSLCGAQSLMRAQHQLSVHGVEAVPRKVMLTALTNMPAAQLAMHHDIHGPSLSLSTACASALDAVGTAAHWIRNGRVDVAIAGGTEGGHSLESGAASKDFVPVLFYAPALMGMLSANDDPGRACMPFDTQRSGIVTSEGSAMFVLERAGRARARGARILGLVRGYGAVADAYHPAAPEPSGKWEARAMQVAIDDAGCAPDDIDALLAHATGTPKGDTAEIHAINAVHGRREVPLSVTSVKGHFGHAAAASGGMSLIAGLLGMARDELVNVARTTNPDPECEFDVLLGVPRTLKIDHFQVNAFGFGGQNASLVISRDARR